MKEFHGQASARVDAEPQTMFDLITDVALHSEWNAAIEAVLEDCRADGTSTTSAIRGLQDQNRPG